jgi:energy-coupling factor transporter ATP-binding protein EcfA2
MIRAENIYLKYYGSDFALKNINLSIEEGEFVLITGPSGSGKSSLIYALAGIIPHIIRVEKYKGRILIEGKDVREVPYCEIAKVCGVVLQNPISQIFGMSVEDDIAFGLENLCVPRKVIKNKLEKILKLVNLEKYRNADPHNLSGGEKQRLVIGSILAMEPKILFLDEPTSNLDPFETKEIFNTLNKLRKLKKTIVIVERKIEHIAPYVDRIVGMKNGKIIFNSSPRKFFSDKKLLKKLCVEPPQVVQLAHKLMEKGIKIKVPLTLEEIKQELLNGVLK